MHIPCQIKKRRIKLPIRQTNIRSGQGLLVYPGLAFLIFLMTVVVYLPVRHAGFVWDDDNYVTENTCLRDVSGLSRIWFQPTALPQYYPLVHTTFWMEYQLWGLEPCGYHLVNVLLHAVNAVLLANLLRQLKVPGAWLAAAIFAVHPVHVESVAWVTERKNVLSGFFYLLAARDFLTFDDQPKLKTYWFRSLLFYVAALLSKTVTATLPPALLVILWWRHGRITRSDLLRLLPFVCVGLPLSLLTIWLEQHHVGAMGAAWELSGSQRFLMAGKSIWFHLGKLFWPIPITFVYPKFVLKTSTPLWMLPSLTVLLTIAVLAAIRRPAMKAVLSSFLLFCGTLFPALGFFDVFPMQYTHAADHYQYLASIPPIALASAFGWQMATLSKPVITRLMIFSAVGVLVLLSIRCNTETHKFYNIETLWRDTISKNPNCSMAHTNLGNELREQGRFQAAASEYKRASRLDKDDPVPAANLAALYLMLGDLTRARELSESVLNTYPDQEVALYNMGLIFSEQGQQADAISFLRRATEVAPDHAPAFNALGLQHAARDELHEAIRCFKRAHELAPLVPDFLVNLGVMELQLVDAATAAQSFEKALRLSPGHLNAMINLAECYEQQKRTTESVPLARQIMLKAPDNAIALQILKNQNE